MNKLKSLTENRYTLNDIFTKNYQIWAVVPLLIYLLTPIAHMIVFSFLYSAEMKNEEITHFFNTGEYAGDYYMPIVQFAFVLGVFFATIAFVAFIANKKEHSLKRFPDNIPIVFFVLFLALIVVSTIVNKTESNYIWGFTVRAEGVTSFFCYYLVYFLCGTFVDKEKYKYFLMYFFLLTGVVIGILTIVNKYFYDITIIRDDFVSGIFYHSNFYAYYLSISIMLASTLAILDKSKVRRILSFFIFAFDTFILAINDSLGGFLACIVAFLFVIFFITLKNKKFCFPALGMFAVFLVIIFVTGLFTPSYFSELSGLGKDVEKIVTDSENAGDAGTARWTLWTHTAQYIKEKPWIGWGFEGTAERLGTETHADKAHNEYLENMAYFGIPAGIIYVAGLMSVYIKAIKRRKYVDNATICCLAGALGYIGSAFVGNSFIFMAPFCFIFLGLANSSLEKLQPVETPAEDLPDDITPEKSDAEEASENDAE